MTFPKGPDSTDIQRQKLELADKCRRNLEQLREVCDQSSKGVNALKRILKAENTNGHFALLDARDKKHELADKLEALMVTIDKETLLYLEALETGTVRIAELCSQLLQGSLDKDEYLSQDFFATPELLQSSTLTIKSHMASLVMLLADLNSQKCGDTLDQSIKLANYVERIHANLNKAIKDSQSPAQEIKNIYAALIPFLQKLEKNEGTAARKPRISLPVLTPDVPFSPAPSLFPPPVEPVATSTSNLSPTETTPSDEEQVIPAPAPLPSVMVDEAGKEFLAQEFKNNLKELEQFFERDWIQVIGFLKELLELNSRFPITHTNTLVDKITDITLDTILGWLIPGLTYKTLCAKTGNVFPLEYQLEKNNYSLLDDNYLSAELFRNPNAFKIFISNLKKYQEHIELLLKKLKTHEKKIQDCFLIQSDNELDYVRATLQEIQTNLAITPIDLNQEQLPNLEKMLDEIIAILQDMNIREREKSRKRNTPQPTAPSANSEAITLEAITHETITHEAPTLDAITAVPVAAAPIAAISPSPSPSSASSPSSPPPSPIPNSPSSSSSPPPAADHSNSDPVSIEPIAIFPATAALAPAPIAPKKADESQRRLDKKEKELKAQIATLQCTMKNVLKNTQALSQLMTEQILPQFADKIDFLNLTRQPVPKALTEGQKNAGFCTTIIEEIVRTGDLIAGFCQELEKQKIPVQDLQPSIIKSIAKFTSASHELYGYVAETSKILELTRFNTLAHTLRKKFMPGHANKMENAALQKTGDAILAYERNFQKTFEELNYILDQINIIGAHSGVTIATISTSSSPSSASSPASPTPNSPIPSFTSSPPISMVKSLDKNAAKIQKKKVELLKSDLREIKGRIEEINNALSKMFTAITKRVLLLTDTEIVDKVKLETQGRISLTTPKTGATLSQLEAIQTSGANIIALYKQLKVADIVPPSDTPKDTPYDHEEMQRFAHELLSRVKDITQAIEEMDSTGTSKKPNETEYHEELLDDACNDIMVAIKCIRELHSKLAMKDFPTLIDQLEQIKSEATLHPELEHRKNIREQAAAIMRHSPRIIAGTFGIAGIGLLAALSLRGGNNTHHHADASVDDHRALVTRPVPDASTPRTDSSTHSRVARTGARVILDAGHDVRDVGIDAHIRDAGSDVRDSGVVETAVHHDAGRDAGLADTRTVPDAGIQDAGRADSAVSVATADSRTVYPPHILPSERIEFDRCIQELRTRVVMCMRLQSTIGIDGIHRSASPIPLPRDLQRENHLDTARTTDDTAHMNGTIFTFTMNGQQYTCDLNTSFSEVGTYYTHVPCTPTSR